MVAPDMLVSATTQDGESTAADTVAVGLFDDGAPSAAERQLAAAAELLASGEARGAFRSLALAHDEGRRWLLVGLGKQADFTPERARVAAAVVHERALEIGARTLCWVAPVAGDLDIARRSSRARRSRTIALTGTSRRRGGGRAAEAPQALIVAAAAADGTTGRERRQATRAAAEPSAAS